MKTALPPRCQVRMPFIRTDPGQPEGTAPCDAGFKAELTLGDKPYGVFSRPLYWYIRPDGLVGIRITSPRLDRPIAIVRILCALGHVYRLHPWEVIECEGSLLNAVPR